MTNNYALEMLHDFQCGWYSSLDDLIDEIEEVPELTVEEANREYVVISYQEDDETVYVEFRLGGTERTITVNSIKEIERM